MPNHIQNKLQVIGTKTEISEVLTFISSKDDKGNDIQIDFNKIVPMPEGMDVQVNSHVKMWVEICTGQIDFNGLFQPLSGNPVEMFKNREYGDLASRLGASTAMEHLTGKRKGNVKDLNEEDFGQFIQCLKNYRQHGGTSWYEWSLANWGTKWNAYGQPDNRNTSDTIYFQTAWSSPIELIRTLSAKFPAVTLQLDYADEDSGSNTGKITMQGGEFVEVIQPESQSNEGYEIYFDLNPGTREEFKLVNGKYEYIDQE